MRSVARTRSWAEHWSRPEAGLDERFEQQVADDVVPLLESLGVSVRGVPMSHPSEENRVVSVAIEGEERIVLKFYRPGRWSLEGLREEAQFLAELAAAGVPAVRPRPLGAAGGIGTWEGIHFACFEFVPSEPHPPDPWREEALRELGGLVARIHAVGQRSGALHRMAIEPLGMGRENLALVEHGQLLPADLLGEYRALIHEIIERGAPLFEAVPVFRLHGDFGVHNLLRSPDGLVVADFDDFMIGPAAFDLTRLHMGLTTPWGDPSQDPEARRRTRSSFIAGYRERLPLADESLRPLETLWGLRMLWSDAWKCARLHDAHFRASRGFLRERRFWLQRLTALREVAATLRP